MNDTLLNKLVTIVVLVVLFLVINSSMATGKLTTVNVDVEMSLKRTVAFSLAVFLYLVVAESYEAGEFKLTGNAFHRAVTYGLLFFMVTSKEVSSLIYNQISTFGKDATKNQEVILAITYVLMYTLLVA